MIWLCVYFVIKSYFKFKKISSKENINEKRNVVWLFFTFLTYILQSTLVPGFAEHSKLSDQVNKVVSVLPQVWEYDAVTDIAVVPDAIIGTPAENFKPALKQKYHYNKMKEYVKKILQTWLQNASQKPVQNNR